LTLLERGPALGKPARIFAVSRMDLKVVGDELVEA
jgi:hypothetical protein